MFLQQFLNSLFFKDGKRRIDFVLVVKPNADGEQDRETFEKNLEKGGLELEHEPAFVCYTNTIPLRFVAYFLLKVLFYIHLYLISAVQVSGAMESWLVGISALAVLYLGHFK